MFNDPNAMIAGFGMMFWLVVLGFYLFTAWTQFKIAQKCGCNDSAWWSFVPLLNIVLWVKMADKPLWWTVLFFVPIVNLYFIFATFWNAAENAGHQGFWGICLGLPLINFVALCVLAFTGEAPNQNRVAPTPPTYDREHTPTHVG